MKQPYLLIVEANDAVGERLSGLLRRGGFLERRVRDEHAVRDAVEKARPDAVLLGPSTVDSAGTLERARQIRAVAGKAPLILIAGVSSEDLAIAALRTGISEYVKSLSDPEDVVAAVRRCLEANAELAELPNGSPPLEGAEGMVGTSAPMCDIRLRIRKLASAESNVLITGETGTGKELIAQLVHANGRRGGKPFLAINCAAIPDSLFESELFGYERGAFTGAQHASEGKIKAANGGTVFLDEVGDMSLYGQSKMLRMIERGEIQRLGRSAGIDVDVRVIAATNRDLETLAGENSFRKDLFFRLAVTSVHLPPLRERKEDLGALLEHYITFYNRRFGRSLERLSDRAMECLCSYDWPGNVRELKNLIEAVFVELPSPDARVGELPAPFYKRSVQIQAASPDERDRLVGALLASNWNKSRAASKLHWSRMTLYRKLARYNIQRN